MSFPLSLLSLFVTLLWVIYSYLVDDLFIKVSIPLCDVVNFFLKTDSKLFGIAVGTSSANAVCSVLEQEEKIDNFRITCCTMN